MRALLVVLTLAAPALADRSDRFIVIARVAEAPPGAITCGVIANRGDVRFDVIELRAGHYPARALIVDALCPERYDVGEVYRLVVRPIAERTRPARRHRVVRETRLRR